MYFKNHLFFSCSFIILIKKIFNIYFVNNDWWHIIPAGLITCLLPDVDHHKSLIGSKFRFFYIYFFSFLGRRKITHSFFFVILFSIFLFNIKNIFNIKFNIDIINGMILGYISHIVADMFTFMGVTFLWPLKIKFRFYFLKNKKCEYYFCLFLFFISLFFDNVLYKLYFYLYNYLLMK